MFLAGMHNGISRLYETFGNGGADTEKRILSPEEYSRTWFRQNPPLPVVTWSQRDNNNYEQSALLSTLNYFSHNTQHYLENYYVKSKRSIMKPQVEGPGAYVLPANAAELNRQLQLLEIMKRQHVEVSQLTEAATATVPAAKRGDPATKVTFPAGSLVVRMDQPYCRAADALLDHQYWAPDDPQKHPYDDTGWSFSELFNLKVVRVPGADILSAKMTVVSNPAALAGKLSGAGAVVAIANTGQSSLLSLVYKLGAAHISVAEKEFESAGQHFPAGSLLIADTADTTLTSALKSLGLDGVRLAAAPSVATHAAVAPKIAVMHTWQSTQTEGWWRYAFDQAGIPYTYISTQTAAAEANLRAKYDVIVFAPTGRGATDAIINGTPMYGNAMPWEKTALTPNLGLLDSTVDTRPGLGYTGLEHLKTFVEHGGLLITSEDTAQFAIETGLAPGVNLAPAGGAKVVGSVLNTAFVSTTNPAAWGYGASLPVMSANGMAFTVSNLAGRGGGRRSLSDPYANRPTGRGSVEDSDVVQGRKDVAPEVAAKTKPWEAPALNEEQMSNNPAILPVALRPEVVLRFAGAKELLLSGLLDTPMSIAERPIVVDAHLGEGNVLLFANNPIYRGETVGSYPMVFNAILNFQHLRPAPKP
jgi:hypothetical protein